MEEKLKSIYLNIHDLLKFAEAKNAMVIAFSGAAILGLLKIICDSKEMLWYIHWYLLFFISLSLLALMVSLVSFAPQTKVAWLGLCREPKGHDNLLFFGCIQHYKPIEYLKSLKEATDIKNNSFTKLELDYAEQIITISKIASRKYVFFRTSIWLLISGVATPLLAALIFILIDPQENN